MSDNSEFLWYIPNDVKPGHRGDSAVENHNSLETLTSHAKALEDHGWKGALVGTGWGRPDTFTVAAALAARTTTGAFRFRRCNARSTERRPRARQHRIGQGQSCRLW